MYTSPSPSLFVSSGLKQTSIGHAIIQASRKAVITPTLFRLGVEMDRVLGSRGS